MYRTAAAIALFNRAAVGVALTNPSCSSWAVASVVLVGLATAVPTIGREGLRYAPSIMATTVSSWLVWSALATWLGNWAFGAEFRKVMWWPLARALAFAQAPGVIRALAVADGTGSAVASVAFVWQAAAMACVIREAYCFRAIWSSLALLAVALAPWLAIQTGILLLLGSP